MTGALYTHTTRATGTILTAAIYNGDHQNHITFGDAQYLGGWSNTVGQMQTQTDPGEQGSESLSSSISDEIERLRFAIKELKQAADSSLTYWYESPVDLAGVGRLPAWYIDGLELSVRTSSPAYIEVATGICRSADDTINMRVSSARHRTVSALWVTAATGGGAGVTWTKFGTYHVFVIKTAASTFDIGFDSVLSASNLLARASGTKYRRIGSLNTGTQSGTMRPVLQNGSYVMFQTAGYDNPSIIGLLPTGAAIANTPFKLPLLPTGLVLEAHIHAYATGAARFRLLDYGVSAGIPDDGIYYGASLTVGVPFDGFLWASPCADIMHNQALAANSVKVVVLGWRDRRQ